MSRIIGVYQLLHKSGYRYIGSSVDCLRRFEAHRRLLLRGCHKSKLVQEFWDNGGQESFEFVVLEECRIEDLRRIEALYLDKYEDTLLNATPAAVYQYTKHSLATREKMRASAKRRVERDGPRIPGLEGRKKLSNLAKQQHVNGTLGYAAWSEESKKNQGIKVGDAKRGTKHSLESRVKMSVGQLKSWSENREARSKAASERAKKMWRSRREHT